MAFRTNFASLLLVVATTLVFTACPCCHGFLQPTILPTTRTMPVQTTTQLAQGGGLFGQGNPLKNIFGTKEAGPKVVVDIPAKEVKIGALRFLLQIHLVGESNKPQPQTWLMKDGGEGELDVYFNDGTGMFSIDLTEYQIKVTRYGEKPSLQYQVQESVMLHSVLDELHKTAFEVEDDIPEEKRLLRFKDGEDDAIEAARSNLMARAA